MGGSLLSTVIGCQTYHLLQFCYLFFFNWIIIDLQCVSFRCTAQRLREKNLRKIRNFSKELGNTFWQRDIYRQWSEEWKWGLIFSKEMEKEVAKTQNRKSSLKWSWLDRQWWLQWAFVSQVKEFAILRPMHTQEHIKVRSGMIKCVRFF